MVICVIGLKLGKVVINSFTTAKCLLVMFMIIAGFSAWHVNVFASSEEFFSEGVGGTLKGTSLLFFGFIGFDEVCCLASRSENPAQVMPRAIAGTLFGATVLSVLAQLALGGMVSNDDDGSTSFEQAFGDNGWAWAKWITAVGEGTCPYDTLLFCFLSLALFPQCYFSRWSSWSVSCLSQSSSLHWRRTG